MSRPARKLLEFSHPGHAAEIDDELGEALLGFARAEAAPSGTRERILHALGVLDEPPTDEHRARHAGLSSERMAEWCIRGRTKRP